MSVLKHMKCAKILPNDIYFKICLGLYILQGLLKLLMLTLLLLILIANKEIVSEG